jgi:polysaccharide export outer membrane protein
MKHGPLLRLPAAVAALAFGTACASVNGPFVWADDYQEPAVSASQYLVGIGDGLTVHVYNNDKLSTKARVRSDGRISVPLLNDLAAAGKTPEELGSEIERKLRDGNIVVSPRVTVLVDDVKPLTVSVLGSVSRAGTYTLDPGSGVAEALASAGGLSPFAHDDRIFVVRRTPTPVRIRFTFASLTDQTGRGSLFRLRSGDIVVAE